MEKPDQTISRKKINPSSIDRFSAFPDEILLHILSFLPTKISVSTSILARRWRFLWSHVPNLLFDRDRDQELSIDTIYNKVLLRYRVENLNVFRLHSGDKSFSMPQLEACIDDAINRNVNQMDLFIIYPKCFPSRIFSCRTVVDLKLSCLGCIHNDNICLPALKKLYISWVLYEALETLSYLLSGCPVLEELILDNLSTEVHCLTVSSRTINRLVIGATFVDYTNKRFTTVKIDAPEVRYLKVRDFVSKIVSAGPLVSLIEADVRLDNFLLSNGIKEYADDDDSDDDDDDSDDDGDDDDDDDDDSDGDSEDVLYARYVLEFVGSLSNVKCLKFTTRWLDVFDSEFSTWSVKFHNLTKLELGSDWRFIPIFLENAENLETLIICTDCTYRKHWIEPKEVPACLLSHLGIVIINDFKCADQEFHMIKYILRNAKVLKRMEIHFFWFGVGLENRYEALKKISSFPRGSVECQIGFVECEISFY